MALFSDQERAFAEIIARLTYINPFLPDRVVHERKALGDAFRDPGNVWHAHAGYTINPNLERIQRDTHHLVETVRRRLDEQRVAENGEKTIYDDMVTYFLYNRHVNDFLTTISKGSGKPVDYYEDFRNELARLLAGVRELSGERDPAHLFACFFQTRRAFHLIFRNIIGGSMAAARLRAAVWQSIFTHDVRRFRRALYNRMGDTTTLITGPSGTGKELVARAIGLARYIPFNAKKRTFGGHFDRYFYPLNLTALSPTLIESELFGHRRGAFTGALNDHIGFLEACPSYGTVFLDEVGEVDTTIQVKLLRVLQTRTFQRLGETEERRFEGKVIAATNREMAAEMAEGRIRQDFFYRLCADQIETPSLREQLSETPEALWDLTMYLAQRIAGEEEAETLTKEVLHFIDGHLGPEYPWPGNVRELEQCVRNILIRGHYQPNHPMGHKGGPLDELTAEMMESRLSAEEMLSRYVTLTYAKTGSYVATAKQLDLDRRTVKARVDEAWLAKLP